MFKTLITTCLLTFSCSGGALHVNHQEEEVHEVRQLEPKKASTGIKQLYGAYCFRDDFNDLVFAPNMYAGSYSVTYYDYTHYNDDLSTPYALNYDLGIDVFDYIAFRQFDISVSTPVYSSSDRAAYRTFTYHLNLGDYSYTESIVVGATANHNLLTDYSYPVQCTILYFPVPVPVGDYDYAVFNSLFTSQPNATCTSYTGYYSFTDNALGENEQWQVMGFCSVDNTLYNYVGFYNGDARAELRGMDANSVFGVDIISNGKFQTNRNVLFQSALINYDIYNVMESTGVFAYQYEQVQYDFGDVIFSVMDAPIYMLSQLFSFQLFGIQFYVAFMSIVTVVLLCFVIKKII